MEARHAIVVIRGENDVLLTEYRAGGNRYTRPRLALERAYDVKRTGEHVKPEQLDMRAHLQCCRPAIDNYCLALPAKCRRGLTDRLFLGMIAAHVFMKGNTAQANPLSLRELRAAAHALELALLLKPVEIAAQRRGTCSEKVIEITEG